MRSEFEKHYLSLDFYTKGSAQLCLDACTFDEKQDTYLPNMDWILENDVDECVIYCCMLNTSYISFKHQQSKMNELTLQVAEMKSRLNDAYTDGQSAMYTARQSKIDELTKQRDSFIKAYEIEIDENIELRKRVDAVKGLAQTLWEKSEEKHQQGKVCESKTLGECADEILDVLEQVIKGGGK